MKKIIIKKEGNTVYVKGMNNYKFEDENEQFLTLRKRGNTKVQNVIDKIPLSHATAQEKKNDVNKLLKNMFGDDWEKSAEYKDQLAWCSMMINHQPSAAVNAPEELILCDCPQMERCDLHV